MFRLQAKDNICCMMLLDIVTSAIPEQNQSFDLLATKYFDFVPCCDQDAQVYSVVPSPLFGTAHNYIEQKYDCCYPRLLRGTKSKLPQDRKFEDARQHPFCAGWYHSHIVLRDKGHLS